MTLLASTRRLVMAPSSNPPRELDAAWFFLLARHKKVLWLGDPEARPKVFEQTGAVVTILVPGGPTLATGPFDGVVVASRDATWTATAFDMSQGELAPDCVIIQLPGSATVPGGRNWISLGGPGPSRRRRQLRRLGTLALARVSRYLPGGVPDLVRQHASDVQFTAIPVDQTPSRDSRHTSVSLAETGPPDYLQILGEKHGHSYDTASWRFGPPRGFASQKVIFVMQRVDDGDEVVVKLTQDPKFNPRLEAEADALQRLGDLDELLMVIPKLVFSDKVGNLAVVCQTRLPGASLRTTLSGDPDDPIARAGFAATIDLSAATVREPVVGESRSAMSALADDVIRIYQPPTAAIAALRSAAATIGQFDLPGVFMHGDLGIWNMLATGHDTVGVLDWENGDPDGVPLWDLFVYARTLGVFMADAAGVRYGASVFSRQLLGSSALQRSLFSHIDTYRRHIDIPAGAVDSLFVMCWAQQAVREAASQIVPTWLQSRGTQLLAAALANPLGYRE